MKISILKNMIAGLAMTGFALAPLSAFALDHDHGQGKGKSHGKSHWNPAPPKKNGRHDNRDWNKNRDWNRRNDDSFNRSSQRVYRPSIQSQIDRRQQTKNEWRNLAIGSGLVGVLGLLTKEPTLTFAGAAGALYSAYRYEQDRKSQSSLARGRAFYFGQPYFYRNGQRFDRRTVTKNGQRYYQFVRHH